MDLKQRRQRLYQITNRRLKDEGWDSITQFTKNSGLEYSVETVRRAFSEAPDKTLGPDVLALILFKLNFTAKEVKEFLEEFTDTSKRDRYLWPRLGETNLAADEGALLNCYRKIIAANPDLRHQVASQLELIASFANVDISKDVKQLQRKSKGA